MPFNLQIIRTSDFIRLNGKGEYDQEETRQALCNIAKACMRRGISRALLDIRDASSDMQLSDLHQLAQAFKEMGFQRNQRLAILYRSQASGHIGFFSLRPADRATFFAMCASEDGWNVKAFDGFEAAVEWLGAVTVEE